MKTIIAITGGVLALGACSTSVPVQEARFQEFCTDNSVEPPIHVDEDLCDRGDGYDYAVPRYAPNYVPEGIFIPPYGQVIVIRERTMQIPSSRSGIRVMTSRYPAAQSPIPPYRPPVASVGGTVPPYVPPTLSPAQKADIDARARAAKQVTPPTVASKVASPGVGIRPAGQTPAPAKAVSTPAKVKR